MNCAEINGLLDALMDGELDEAQRQALEAHGRECPECAEAIRATMQMKALFAEMRDEADVPLAAQARWRGAVRDQARRKGRGRLARWIGSAAAAVVVLVGVGLALNMNGAPQKSAETAVQAVEERADAGAGEEAEEALAYDGLEAANGAVLEADGAMADAEAAPEAVEFEAPGFAVRAAVAQRAPACELALSVADVDTACARIRDLASEYEGVADAQRREDGGANVYVELSGENAGDFLSAVLPMDEGDHDDALPELAGEGSVLVLLTVDKLE